MARMIAITIILLSLSSKAVTIQQSAAENLDSSFLVNVVQFFGGFLNAIGAGKAIPAWSNCTGDIGKFTSSVNQITIQIIQGNYSQIIVEVTQTIVLYKDLV